MTRLRGSWRVVAVNWGAIALCVLFWVYVFTLFFGGR